MSGQTCIHPIIKLMNIHSSQRSRFLLFLSALLVICFMLLSTAKAGNIVAVRSWPSEDNSRVTIEHDGTILYRYFLLPNPSRLVMDLREAPLNDVLKSLSERIQPNDPFIKSARVAQFDKETVRLVFDLHQAVSPQVFLLDPVGQYQRRLVLDVYPKNTRKTTAVSSRPAKRTSTQPAQSSSSAKVPSGPVSLSRRVTIAIDPGHGGEDSGALGYNNSKEKDVVLSIARRLKRIVESQPNMRVLMTRNADFFVPLGNRPKKARAAKADLFISIHADAATSSSAHGSSVFVLSEKGASSATARTLANRENASDLIGGVNIKHQDSQVASVLVDMSVSGQIKQSMKLANGVLKEMEKINSLHKSHVEQAAFAVLKSPDIPSILVETAFISNPEEEAKLNSASHQEAIANAIMNGIKAYFAQNPPLAK